MASDKIAFFTLFHSPSGAGYTPECRETMKGVGGGNELNLSTVEERTCGSSSLGPVWGVYVRVISTHPVHMWKLRGIFFIARE